MKHVPNRVRLAVFLALLVASGFGFVPPLSAQSLRGSPASMDIQNRMAHAHDYTFIRTASQVRRFVDAGYLVPVRGNADFELHDVSFPYARPEVALFARRLASQYRAACGEKLVITSLTRPENRQPANASSRSVHPTGMAMDLRRSSKASCRRWLESVLLDLEGSDLLEATREHYPPHYHVALFTQEYADYVDRRASADDTRSAEQSVQAADDVEYEVRRGDSLWTIARAYGISVDDLRDRNDLRGSRIYAGQVLQVPVARR